MVHSQESFPPNSATGHKNNGPRGQLGARATTRRVLTLYWAILVSSGALVKYRWFDGVEKRLVSHTE